MRPRANRIWEKLTFIAFFTTLPLYSPNLAFGPMLGGFNAAMPYFANATLGTAAVTATAIAFMSLKMSISTPTRRTRILSTCALASLYLIGFCLLFWALIMPGAQPGTQAFAPDARLSSALGLVAGLLCGSCSVVLCILWSQLFSSFSFRSALLHLSALIAVSALLNFALSTLPATAVPPVFALLVLTGIVSPVFRASLPPQRQVDDQGPSGQERLDPDNRYLGNKLATEGSAAVLVRLLSVIIAPLIGFLLFAFTMAVRKLLVFEVIYAETIGALVAALIVLPLCFLRSEKPLLPFIYQVFLPIIAGILVILSSFPDDSLPARIGSIGVYVFFEVLGLFALASLAAAANAREFPVVLIFSLALAAFAIVSIIGIWLGAIPLISEQFVAMTIVLSTLYFIYLLLSPGIKAWWTMYAPQKPASTSATLSELEDRCTAVAQSGGLSKRESEILLYLGRGYSPAYIAKKLFLSDSTVRSHIKSIYRKLSIHTREELLQLIDL